MTISSPEREAKKVKIAVLRRSSVSRTSSPVLLIQKATSLWCSIFFYSEAIKQRGPLALIRRVLRRGSNFMIYFFTRRVSTNCYIHHPKKCINTPYLLAPSYSCVYKDRRIPHLNMSTKGQQKPSLLTPERSKTLTNYSFPFFIFNFNRKSAIMCSSSDDVILRTPPSSSEENLSSVTRSDEEKNESERVSTKSILSVKKDYNELIDPQKGTLIIQGLVLKAIENNNTSISITLFNKATAKIRSNYSSVTFVKAGKELPDIQSLIYLHQIHGQGRLYPNLGVALKTNNLTYNQYYFSLKNKTSLSKGIVLLTDSEKDLLDLNLFNPMSQIKDTFPKDILHSSLLADGYISPKQINSAFSLSQTATPEIGKNGLEHISYLLYIFSKIPPSFFGNKPLSLHFDKKKGFWKFLLTTRSFPLLYSYYKSFYPKGTLKTSGWKEMPPLSYLKSTIVTDYNTVAHFILQDGSILGYEIRLYPCPNSYKGNARIALALTESLGIHCFVKTKNDGERTTFLIIIIRASMDVIIGNTQDLLKLMPYKNLTLKPPPDLVKYNANIVKAQRWYTKNINQLWVDTYEM